MTLRLFTYWMVVLFGFASCESEIVSPANDQLLKIEKVIPKGDEDYLNKGSDFIFDQDQLHTFEITIPESNLAKIDSDPAAEVYVESSLTFNGETISPVGIRYKGSIGAFVNCLSGADWSDPSGWKVCTKLSLKIKFNWDGSENKFYGLKKLQFHSQNLDPSQMRERLAYWLFREMSVPAPRSVHAKVMINGVYSGIYALTEQIDGRFTRENFVDGSGNVYKEVWPLDMNGKPQTQQTYLAHLKTNKDESPNANMMQTFANEMAEASTASMQSVITKWMDIDKIMSLIVVDRTIRVDDGPFHWYCGNNYCSNHNYYWYEESGEGKMHLIPWDMDNAFENIATNVNPVTPIADAWGSVRNDCEPFNYGLFQGLQRSAACDKLTAGWVMFHEEFEREKSRLMLGPFSEGIVNTQLLTWEQQIHEATLEASLTYDDALPIAEWEEALANLRVNLNVARSK